MRQKSIAVLKVSFLAASLAILQTSVFAENSEQASSGAAPTVKVPINQQPLFTPNEPEVQSNAQSINTTQTFWTPERMRKAKPLPLPRSSQGVVTGVTIQDIGHIGKSQASSGAAPRVKVPINQQPLFTPNKRKFQSNSIQPDNEGTKSASFTSSELVPLSADLSYPYVASGKLFFSNSEGDFLCSAAVIKPRLILTAGHCVHSGSGGNNGFYSNFVFIPAYRDGTAPYGQWSWSHVITTNTWITGSGSEPNAADYAIIELSDQSFNGVSTTIGSVVGYFGTKTLDLLPNHVTMLGYPGNLDSGEKMHQITAGSYGSGGNNTAIYGSDMSEGSSGGPWVENFGVAADGQVNGSDTSLNEIVGLTSYGPTAVGPLYQGSSILDSRFTSILNTACAWNPGNC
ncbi:MAG: trypsin-like peptidase domain-containing protein [Nostoc sp.]|uniref:trypsin-like serine peptidase n=1 Tax=Nostoc sp. TaxID=1180 RepID=UPI002FF89105